MKSSLALVILLAAAVCSQGQTAKHSRAARRQPASADALAPAPAGQTLPIRRVVLYSNGVAYVERRGTVAGRAEVNLSFKQSQVDDVLKSMVVLDLGRGRIGAVSYNSSAPPSARMADIPFSVSPETRGGGGLAGVLGQLQGARVVVTTAAGRTAAGSVLTVEEHRTQPAPDKPATTKHALVIASEGGELSSFDLEDLRSVKLVDEGARRDVGEFAAAAASARRRDAKTITVTSEGDGAREMVVSYTIAAPIWKTTYRVVLDSEGKPFFQGWAIVDNVSEEDWEGVRLSLVSGTPVSFIQPIQKPFYRYRPVIPMPSDLQLTPQVHEPETGEVGGPGNISGAVQDVNGAAVAGAEVVITDDSTGRQLSTRTNEQGFFNTQRLSPGNYTVRVNSTGFSQAVVTNVRVGGARPANFAVTLSAAGMHEAVSVSADALPPAPTANAVNNLTLARLAPGTAGKDAEEEADEDEVMSVGEALTGGGSGVEAAAEGGEVGDLFEYQIGHPVTVRRDRSALIPIVQTRMEGARVSVFREAARRTRPMSGMLLKNTTPLTLEGGAVTVLDGDAYAGEALMERLKPSEQRLVSFALDLGTLVTVRHEGGDSPAFFVRIANGTLYASHFNRSNKLYTLTNQTERPRTVYVEHPVREGWALDDETPKPDGKSASFYRFRVELGPHSSAELRVVERQPTIQSYSLSNMTSEQIQFFVARRYVDERTRAALDSFLDLKARLAAAAARVLAVEQEAAAIAADQKRLRENIEALNKTAEARQLITRYVQKADQQETRLEQLAREKQAAADERQRLQDQLNAALRALAHERKLE